MSYLRHIFGAYSRWAVLGLLCGLVVVGVVERVVFETPAGHVLFSPSIFNPQTEAGEMLVTENIEVSDPTESIEILSGFSSGIFLDFIQLRSGRFLIESQIKNIVGMDRGISAPDKFGEHFFSGGSIKIFEPQTSLNSYSGSISEILGNTVGFNHISVGAIRLQKIHAPSFLLWHFINPDISAQLRLFSFPLVVGEPSKNDSDKGEKKSSNSANSLKIKISKSSNTISKNPESMTSKNEDNGWLIIKVVGGGIFSAIVYAVLKAFRRMY